MAFCLDNGYSRRQMLLQCLLLQRLQQLRALMRQEIKILVMEGYLAGGGFIYTDLGGKAVIYIKSNFS